MPRKQTKGNSRIQQGQELARRLFDRNLRDLENMSTEEKAQFRLEFSRLSSAQVDDVIQQTIEAKQYHRERVGWQAIPHDIAVLVLVIVTAIIDLLTGVIACIATLVLLEGIFQFYFNRKLYRPLSTLVWLTYPSYILFGYLLYRDGYTIWWIIVGVLLAWMGTFILGSLARLPVRLILESRAKGVEEAVRRKAERDKQSKAEKK